MSSGLDRKRQYLSVLWSRMPRGWALKTEAAVDNLSKFLACLEFWGFCREQILILGVFWLVIGTSGMPDKLSVCKSGVKREPSIFRYVNLERKLKVGNVFRILGYNCINDIADSPVSGALGIEPIGAAPILRTIQRIKAGMLTAARFFLGHLYSSHIR